MLKPVEGVRWGTDPEGFFFRDGVIGSEKLIPERGLRSVSGKIVRDGVQFELNPASADNIPELGRNISGLFKNLKRCLAKHEGVSVSFQTLAEVSKEELESLAPSSQVLGCMPSFNFYGEKPILVDPLVYLKRSTGGHIHTGLTDIRLMQERRRMVPIYDALVGVPCVLLDRDTGAVERRRNYGRAGEYRTPDHGLEYRTISNFWLRDYTLMSFAFGMANIAHSLAYQAIVENDTKLLKEFAQHVNPRNNVYAIDNNNWYRAHDALVSLVPFLRKHLPQKGFVLNPGNLETFQKFIQGTVYGTEQWFSTTGVVDRWIKGPQVEFDEFLSKQK